MAKCYLRVRTWFRPENTGHPDTQWLRALLLANCVYALVTWISRRIGKMLTAAEHNGCSDETIRALKAIPPETFTNIAQVTACVTIGDDGDIAETDNPAPRGCFRRVCHSKEIACQQYWWTDIRCALPLAGFCRALVEKTVCPGQLVTAFQLLAMWRNASVGAGVNA